MNLNIVIPMSGKGSRFRDAGYTVPKPFIPILGKPMIELVVNNLKPARPHQFIFLCLQEHIEKFKLDEYLTELSPNSVVVSIPEVTKGAACTVLHAKHLIDNDKPLMIANSDQWINIFIDDYLHAVDKSNSDGLIMTMHANDPKWSYLRFENGNICEVVEKKVVSNEATVGIYNFFRGRDFVSAAEEMIKYNLQVNNEFYVAPSYNQLIKRGAKISYYNIGKEGEGMYGLGTPTDYDKFLSSGIANKAISFCINHSLKSIKGS